MSILDTHPRLIYGAFRMVTREFVADNSQWFTAAPENPNRYWLGIYGPITGQLVALPFQQSAADAGHILHVSGGLELSYTKDPFVVGVEWFVRSVGAGFNVAVVEVVIDDSARGLEAFSGQQQTSRQESTARNGRNDGFPIAWTESEPARRGDLAAVHQQVLDILRRRRCARRRDNGVPRNERPNPYL